MATCFDELWLPLATKIKKIGLLGVNNRYQILVELNSKLCMLACHLP
jgi:hypothetical protein